MCERDLSEAADSVRTDGVSEVSGNKWLLCLLARCDRKLSPPRHLSCRSLTSASSHIVWIVGLVVLVKNHLPGHRLDHRAMSDHAVCQCQKSS